MHALSLFDDVFGEDTERDGPARSGAMEIIGEEGAGVVVLINRPLPDHAQRALAARDAGTAPSDDDMPTSCATTASARRSSPSSACTTWSC